MPTFLPFLLRIEDMYYTFLFMNYGNSTCWTLYLQLLPSALKIQCHSYINFRVSKTQILGKVLKADYHGCILKAVRCKNPSIVGKEGILVQETENTFKIITRQDRLLTIPKENTVFNFELPPPHKEIITLYGNQLCFRSADRSLRKYKFKPTVEL